MHDMRYTDATRMDRRLWLYGFIAAFLLVLVVSKITILTDEYSALWWWFVLLWGTMWAGFVSQPITKKLFPTAKAADAGTESDLVLKDHETLAGYYPFAALTVACGALLIPILENQTGSIALFAIPHPLTFWVAAVIAGALNVGVFFFFIKALRYGDLSLSFLPRKH
jgi:hypothetical protein